MFQASMVALVTPMHPDGSLDLDTFLHLIDWHLQSQTDAIVIAGTTGESATLDADEQAKLISLAVKHVNGRIPIIAGSGTNATHTSIAYTKLAQQAGADACLIVTPYYNKPTQNGLYAHYKAIAESVDIPIILYNVPSRTSCDLLPETIARLAPIKNIIGIKEATGKVERIKEIIQLTGERFAIYSGDDATALQLMEHGAKGVISVTANVSPDKMHAMCHFALAGKFTEAAKINQELQLLHEYLFLETNPIPTKWALEKMQKIKSGLRLPLVPLDERYYLQVQKALEQAGVL